MSRGGKSSKKPFQAVRGQHSLGYYATAEEAALTYARFIAQEERQEQIAGGGAPPPRPPSPRPRPRRAGGRVPPHHASPYLAPISPGELKPKRERKHSGKITRCEITPPAPPWTPTPPAPHLASTRLPPCLQVD